MDYPYTSEKHCFTLRFDSNDNERHTEIIFNELYLTDILARFREFLQGCGYEIDGEIVVQNFQQEENKLMQNPMREHADRNYDGYKMTEPSKHEPKWDFNNIPNNNWPFGKFTTEPLPSLTTVDLSSLTVTDLTTGETKSHSDWAGLNKYPTMAPLTTEQIQSFTVSMPGTLGAPKYQWSDKDAY